MISAWRTGILLMALCPAMGWGGVDLAMMQGEGDEEILMALYGDEEVISIATGTEKRLHLAPSVATVITAEEIRGMGASHLDQVLERVPGLHVAISSTSRVNPVYTIRGVYSAYNPQVLVLMNGAPFPHLFSGGRPETFRLPVENIQRIEVIRGPGSALHGADAFSGLINIITKSPTEIGGTRLGLRLGSFDTYEGWIQHAARAAGWDLSMSLELSSAGGDPGRIVDQDLQTTLDQANGTTLSLAPGPLETANNIVNAHLQAEKDDWTFRLWGWIQEDGGMGAGGAQALDPAGRQDIDQVMIDVLHHRSLMDGLEAKLRFNLFYSRDDSYFQIFPSGVIGNPMSDDVITGLEGSLIHTRFPDHRLQLLGGYKYMDEQTGEIKNFGSGVVAGVMTDVSNTPYVYLQDNYRHLWYLALQDEWSMLPDWELTAGARYDHFSDFGGVLNPRIALVWSTLYNLTTKLMYGRAFRAPSFSELHIVNNPALLGNPELNPETIQSWELAFDFRPTLGLRTGLNLFRYQLNDQIDYVQDAGATTSTAQNANRVDGSGFEFEAGWQATEELALNANFAYQRSEDAATGHRTGYAPAWQFQTGAHWRFLSDWSANVSLNWVGDRPRAEGDTRPKISDYAVVDMALRRENLWEGLEGALIVRNLFNADAREPSPAEIPNDYPLEGLGIFGEIRFQFESD